MSIREDILHAVEDRLRTIEGMSVFRNPKTPPPAENLPFTSIFTGDDDVMDMTLTGDYPILTREWSMILVFYMTGTDDFDDEAAETEINEFVDTGRKAIYAGGANLDGKCVAVYEKGAGKLLKPYVGEPGIGLPVEFGFQYVEDTSEYFF